MNNILLLQSGEMQMGKIKTSINIDENVWKDFSVIVLQKEGGRKLSDVIESLIKQYIKKNGVMEK